MSERELQKLVGEMRLAKLDKFSDEFKALIQKFCPEYDPILVGQLQERVDIYKSGAWND